MLSLIFQGFYRYESWRNWGNGSTGKCSLIIHLKNSKQGDLQSKKEQQVWTSRLGEGVGSTEGHGTSPITNVKGILVGMAVFPPTLLRVK